MLPINNEKRMSEVAHPFMRAIGYSLPQSTLFAPLFIALSSVS